MGVPHFWFILIAMLLVSISPQSTVTSQVQGCSLVGMDLQHCLASSTAAPFSLDSCCSSLNQAVQAGYYCLCSLLGPSNHPVFSTELALSLSNCYISMPPLTHCHEPQPAVTSQPVATVPQPNPPPPALAELLPPDLPRDDQFVPLPPKVNEIPLNSKGDNSSAADQNPSLSSSPLPEMSIPERWGYISSGPANLKMLLLSRNLLMVAVIACIVIA